MSKVVIKDFLLELGFDGKKVEKGIDSVESRLEKVGKTQVANEKKNTKATKETSKAKEKGLKTSRAAAKKKREELALTRAQYQLEKRMHKASQMGMNRNHHHVKSLQKGYKDINKIKQYTANLDTRMFRQQALADIAKAKAAKSPDGSGNAAKVKQLKEEMRNLKKSHTIEKRKLKTSQKHTKDIKRRNKSYRSQNGLLTGMAKKLLIAGSMYGMASGALGAVGTGFSQQVEQQRAETVLGGVGEAAGLGGNFGGGKGSRSRAFQDSMNALYGAAPSDIAATQKGIFTASMQHLQSGRVTEQDLNDIIEGQAAGNVAGKLDASAQQRVSLALNQMMAKGKIQAEEFTRQLAPANPKAAIAMTKAVEKWAKLNGTVGKDVEFTQGMMLKLMKEGKLISSEILPEYGRQMKMLATSMLKDGQTFKDLAQSTMGGSMDVAGASMQKFWRDTFTDDAFKPMSNFVNELTRGLENSYHISDRLGAYLGNIANELTNLIKPLIDDMVDAEGEYLDNLTDAKFIASETKRIFEEVRDTFKQITAFANGFSTTMSAIWEVVSSVADSFLSIAQSFGLIGEGETSMAEFAGSAAAALISIKAIGALLGAMKVLQLGSGLVGFIAKHPVVAAALASTGAIASSSISNAAKGITENPIGVSGERTASLSAQIAKDLIQGKQGNAMSANTFANNQSYGNGSSILNNMLTQAGRDYDRNTTGSQAAPANGGGGKLQIEVSTSVDDSGNIIPLIQRVVQDNEEELNTSDMGSIR